MNRIANHSLILIAGMILLFSCLRKAPETPPDTSGFDPHLTVTHTIAKFKSLNGKYDFHTGGDSTLITADIIISGIVTADDRSGNFYKQIVIEDSTGGLMVLIDAYSLYNDYPVGRKIYIKCKGLFLGYDGGLPELGIMPAEGLVPIGIHGSAVSDHLVKADIGHSTTPVAMTLAQAKNADTNLYDRLITIQDAEFADTGKPYAQPNGTTNRDLEDCYGNKLPVRNSNYSSFAIYSLPKGKGAITGIYTVYISSISGSKTPQLLIRDTSDVVFNAPRCNGGAVTPAAIISIDSLRKLYPGSGTYTLPVAKITGVVISDIDKGNVSFGNFILEDASRKGVILYLSGSTAYKLGDSLVLDVTGAKLQLYSGAIELTGLTSSKITKAASGKTVIATTLTIAQLNANFALYESTLVKILNGSFTSGGNYSGSKTLADGTGYIALYTASAATFSGQAVSSTAKTYTGIATPYTSGTPPTELKLRDPTIDVY